MAERVYAAKLLSVIDGDTSKFAVRLKRSAAKPADLGFHVYYEDGWLVVHESFRFFGINCPEHGTPEGDAATAYVKNIMQPGDKVTLHTVLVAGQDKQEKYGRWLATIFTPNSTTSLNDRLVQDGHAKPWDGKGGKPV